MSRFGREVRWHVPLLIALPIFLVGSLDVAPFAPLKTELAYGWWVVVLFPLASLLALTQLALWILRLLRHAGRRRSASSGL